MDDEAAVRAIPMRARGHGSIEPVSLCSKRKIIFDGKSSNPSASDPRRSDDLSPVLERATDP